MTTVTMSARLKPPEASDTLAPDEGLTLALTPAPTPGSALALAPAATPGSAAEVGVGSCRRRRGTLMPADAKSIHPALCSKLFMMTCTMRPNWGTPPQLACHRFRCTRSASVGEMAALLGKAQPASSDAPADSTDASGTWPSKT